MTYARDSGYESGMQDGLQQGKAASSIKQWLKYRASKEQIIQDLMGEFHIDEKDAVQKFSQYQNDYV